MSLNWAGQRGTSITRPMAMLACDKSLTKQPGKLPRCHFCMTAHVWQWKKRWNFELLQDFASFERALGRCEWQMMCQRSGRAMAASPEVTLSDFFLTFLSSEPMGLQGSSAASCPKFNILVPARTLTWERVLLQEQTSGGDANEVACEIYMIPTACDCQSCMTYLRL